MTNVLVKDRGRKRPCEDRGKDWTDAATAQEGSSRQKLEEARKDSSLELLEGMWLTH